MKNLFRILTFSIILYSCSKNDNTDNSSIGTASLKFKLDGEQQEFIGNAPTLFGSGSGRGAVCARVNYSEGRGYMIQGYNVDSIISISILTDSLHTGAYNAYFGGSSLGYFNLGYYALKNSSQIFNISITRHSSGTIDGNFSGKFYQEVANPDSISISEGEFKNVKVHYY